MTLLIKQFLRLFQWSLMVPLLMGMIGLFCINIANAEATNGTKFMPISTQKHKLQKGGKFISLRSSGAGSSAIKLDSKVKKSYSLANYKPHARASFQLNTKGIAKKLKKEIAEESKLKHQPEKAALKEDNDLKEQEVSTLPLKDISPAAKPAQSDKRSPEKRSKHQWPLDPQADQYISSLFGTRKHPVTGKQSFHEGLDIAAAKGTKVLASAAGTVESIGTHPRLGKYVKVRHDENSYSLYGHLSKITAKVGQRTQQGQKLGEVGNTGRSTGNHLDYSLRINGKAVNPEHHLPEMPSRHQKMASAR